MNRRQLLKRLIAVVAAPAVLPFISSTSAKPIQAVNATEDKVKEAEITLQLWRNGMISTDAMLDDFGLNFDNEVRLMRKEQQKISLITLASE